MAARFEDRVRCSGCNHNLMLLRFSETSLRKYRESLARSQRNRQVTINFPRCTECNKGGNRQEMTCAMCDQTMGLESFARAQRKRHDDAHCLDCQQEKIDREPDHNDAVKEGIIMEQIERNDQYAATTSMYSSAASGSQRSQLQSDRYETDTNPATNWVDGNDDAISVRLAKTTLSDNSSVSTRIVTGTGWDTYPRSERRQSNMTQNSSSRFAKQNAVPKDPHQKAQEQLQREQERKKKEAEQVQPASSDESEDGEDDDNDDDVPY